MAEVKEKRVRLKLTAESSWGHINHDSDVEFQFLSSGLFVSHCEATLIWDRKQVDKLIRFLEKNKELIGKE